MSLRAIGVTAHIRFPAFLGRKYIALCVHTALLHILAQAAATQRRTLGGPNNRHFVRGLEAGRPPPRCPLRGLFLPGRQWPRSVLTRPVPGHTWRESGLSGVSSCRDQDPTCTTSLYLNHFLRGPISECGHPGRRGFDIRIWLGRRHPGHNTSCRSSVHLSGGTRVASVPWLL